MVRERFLDPYFWYLIWGHVGGYAPRISEEERITRTNLMHYS